MEFHDHVVVVVDGVGMVKVEIVVVEQNVVEFQIEVVGNVEIVVDVAAVGVVHHLLVEEQSVVGYQIEEGNLVVVDFVVVVGVEELHSLVVAYHQNLEMLEVVVASYVVVVVHPSLVKMVDEIVVLVLVGEVVVDCFVLEMTLAGIHVVVVVQHFVGVVQIQSLVVVVDLQIVVVVDCYFHLGEEIVEDVVVDVVHDDD
jgi:hypothetical protein